jgi:homoserine kinase
MPSVVVRVPASSANIGPGFDSLGVALSLYNRIRFTWDRSGAIPVSVVATGESASELHGGGDSLTYRAARSVFTEVGLPAPALRIEIESRIPLRRGMGSSSSAIVGGLFGANALLGESLSRERLMERAAEIEGHPDNVTPALFGGFQVCRMGEGDIASLRRLRLPVDLDNLDLIAVVCIPEGNLSTTASREALPDAYPRADAVANLSSVGLLVGALCAGELHLLRDALQDRLHQPYRAKLLPALYPVIRAAEEAGAYGACLSGSGSAMLALSPCNRAEAVGAAMVRAAEAVGVPARSLCLEIDRDGAIVEEGIPFASGQ